MKKIWLTGGVVVIFAAYAFYKNMNPATVVVTGDNTETSQIVPTPNPAPTPNPQPAPTPNPTPTPVSSGRYKDGTYTGNAIKFFYGTYQVKAIVKEGKLSDIAFLQYPNDRDTSIQINTEAMPILKSEAIRAQSADVDNVSGATDSTEAFRESLSSALSSALAKA